MKPKDPDSEQPPETIGVGYCCPPAATRFTPGKSGNPRGRPKGSLNSGTLLSKLLRERVTIRENGRRKRITKHEATLKQLVNKAVSGDLPATRVLLEVVRDLESKCTAPESRINSPITSDQEIIAGILQRFQNQNDYSAQTEEIIEENDERS
jgi:hypothetical protein